MKKLLSPFFAFVLLLVAATGCSSEQSSSSNKNDDKKQEAKAPLSKEEFAKMISNPDKYKGAKVDFYAKIFVEPEKDDDGIYIQAFADPKNSEQNVIVVADPKTNVKNEDIIHVIGTVRKSFEGENALGGKVTAPIIDAEKVEKTDYVTAFSKPIKTIDVNKEINQHGYIVKLNKVEIAEDETRAYVTISNQSNAKINFWGYNAKLLVGNTQHDRADNFEAGYPEIPSDILPKTNVEAIIPFPAVDPNEKVIKFYFEGSSDNYDIEINPFQFEINIAQ
ncbi:hypothetical protein [Parageobacillus thermoglucosidasius]|uniref:DUF4352 domain-containing protein n=1 Tax=Parageobacillus thermoglucosidasius TaxID=1426 RepID=A0AAN1D6J3_PARTM|nr:hypothetical protein [Parageobacillus thermoglucosidasius]AEH48646.1 hypothetical protein Geoth_2758 [Parageobacillus thermoglucosidasius C56-YS93]ALF10096.1 hypothetical protein AOT13_08795 [Parageobacillus thermoglucosidasius]ANZ30178.1 DUF4352 domain-containing protein [Parageobacillus thermoglucosidasius]APM80915.1 DUF4352 domain-containing protein [Parageobacillus thermoglucosidasius]KJX70631.1 hypothetical protein WH82_00495 [Parageobacillus thermoglucosidasius]